MKKKKIKPKQHQANMKPVAGKTSDAVTLRARGKAKPGSDQHSIFKLCLKCNGNGLQGIPVG